MFSVTSSLETVDVIPVPPVNLKVSLFVIVLEPESPAAIKELNCAAVVFLFTVTVLVFLVTLISLLLLFHPLNLL